MRKVRSISLYQEAIDEVVPEISSDVSHSPFDSSTTFTEESLLQARDWFEDCVQSHMDYCAGATWNSSFLPTRLLAVGEAETLTVCVQTSFSHHEPYATLSHCRGDSQILRLTSATLETFQTGIPLTTLPKTFRDVVHVVRKLGFKYVWIDSLCEYQLCFCPQYL